MERLEAFATSVFALIYKNGEKMKLNKLFNPNIMSFINAKRLKELEKTKWDLDQLSSTFEEKLELAVKIKEAGLEIKFAHEEHIQAEKYTQKLESVIKDLAAIAKEKVSTPATIINNG